MSVTRRYIRMTTLTSWDAGGSNYNEHYARVGEINLLDSGDTPISRAGWTVSASSYDVDFNTPPSLAIDSDNSTAWVTTIFASQPPHPHTFTIDQGSAIQVYKFRLTNATNVDGAIGGYEIHSSPDNTNWTLCGSGTFNTGTPSGAASFDTAELQEVAAGGSAVVPILENYRNMMLR